VTVVAPAICDHCGTIFPSGFAFGDGTYSLSGNKSGPCPNCKGMGSVPDGVYEVYNGALTILSGWTPEDRKSLGSALSIAQSAHDIEAAEEALKAWPELFAAIQARIVPGNPAEFWTMVAAIFAALLYFAK